MRKWFIIFYYLIFSLFNMCSAYYNVLASSKFARIMETTTLYKSPTINEDISNIYCLAEKTYFVEILSEFEDVYEVNYNDTIGYVKKNDVKEITNTPSTPYPYNIKLSLNSPCNLRRTPTTKSNTNNIIAPLNQDETNFIFIGRVFADEAIDFGGSAWYLVKYNGEYGYIYNKYVKSISPIYDNTENVSFVEKQSNNIKNPITSTPAIIIVILLLIPCLFILIILYLPRKPKTKKHTHIEEIYKY